LKLVKDIFSDYDRSGVTVLFTKHTNNIDMMIKTLIITEKKVVNRREVKVLARDTGNTKRNENMAPQNI
jgi:ABC-type uncharacterized transport system ATPase subunit